MFKTWSAWCIKHNMTATYKWVSRTLNARADKLSKYTPLSWQLTRKAINAIKSFFPNMTTTLPDMNQIANCLGKLKQQKAATLIIHPVWPAAKWWHKLNQAAIRIAPLPNAQISLASTSGKTAPAKWQMRASWVSFEEANEDLCT